MNEKKNQQAQLIDDEIDLRELFATLWGGKWVIFLFTFVFSFAGVAYALYKPNIYQSSVIVAPTQEEGGGLNGLAGKFGGLASLAGINLSGGGSNQIVIAKEVLQSRAFQSAFFQRHNLAAPLMAVKGWNESSGELVYESSKYNPETSEWKFNSRGKSYKPSDWDMVETFREDHFSVNEAKDTGMITISVRHYSPIVAQQWAQWLVEDVNEHIRKEDVKDAEASIAYLQEKLKETSVAGMQQVFYQLIESETRTVMLANARSEYVFRTVDPAVVSGEKIEPMRTLIVLGSALLGTTLGVFSVFMLGFIRLDNGCVTEKY